MMHLPIVNGGTGRHVSIGALTPSRDREAPAGSNRLRNDVQALRGFAVLLVLLYHAQLGLLPAGYLGVDIFFVISGYLISSLIARGLSDGTFSFKEFYSRRAKRLLPAAYVVLFGTFILSFVFLTETEYNGFCQQLIGALTLTGNVALWQQTNYFSGAAHLKPLLHTWSLAIEEQYYLVLPLALTIIPKRVWGWSSAVVVLTSLALYVGLRHVSPAATFYLLPTRAWELTIGCFGALVLDGAHGQRLLRWLLWPAIAVLCVVPAMSPGVEAHPGLNTVAVCLATLVTILARSPALNQSIVCSYFAELGKISYSLYLVHWPLFAFLSNVYLGGPTPLSLRLTVLAGSVVLAYGLYHFVEAPIRYSKRPLLLKLAGGGLVASVLLLVSPQGAIASAAGGRDYAHIRRPNYGFGPDCDFLARFTPKSACRSSDHPEALVWGDSHAMHLVPGIRGTSQLGLLQATRGSCAPLLGIAPVIHRLSRTAPQDCLSFNRSVLDYLSDASTIDVVVLSSPFAAYVSPDAIGLRVEAGQSTPAPLGVDVTIDAMRRTVRELRRLGKRVIVVSPPPRGNFDIGQCLERLDSEKVILGPHGRCELQLEEFYHQQADVRTFLARLPLEADVDVIRLEESLCSEQGCLTMLDGAFLYSDEQHLTHEGSILIAKKADLVRRVLAGAR